MPGIMLVECIILRTDVLLLCVVLSVMRTFNQSAVFTFSHFQRRRFRSQGTGSVRPQRRKKKGKKKVPISRKCSEGKGLSALPVSPLIILTLCG